MSPPPEPLPATLARAIAVDPSDEQARLVFADWLQSRGDPWGELLALEHAGRGVEARALFAAERQHFSGAFDDIDLQWQRGLPHVATLRDEPPGCTARLDALLRLRAAPLLHELRVVGPSTRELVERINAQLPWLRHLFIWLGPELELALPHLDHLRLWIDDLAGDRLDSLLAAPSLPSLRRLQLIGGNDEQLVLPAPLLVRLLASPLVRQLEQLAITQGLLSAASAQTLVDGAPRLAHLTAVNFHLTGLDDLAVLQRTFGDRLRQWQYATDDKKT